MSDETVRERTGFDATVREGQAQETVRGVDAATAREADATLSERRSAASTSRESHATLREMGAGTMREAGVVSRDACAATTHEGDDVAFAWHAQGPRMALPESVRNGGYEWVRDLDVVGGEADVSVIRASGVEYFFKRYHRGLRPNEDVLRVLREESDSAHVVQIVDYSVDSQDAWEIHEYCPLGTIGRGLWADAHPLPHEPETVQEILTETAQAIHHIHHVGDGVAHRDIKPSNILIRSAEEDGSLDLVLTDFGIARDDQAVTHRTTFGGTNLYAAPEAYKGKSSKESDWFALGSIIFELLTGEMLLAGEEGQPLDSWNISANCLTGHYYNNVSRASFPDDRWAALVKGLVTYDREHRWGYDEVRQWLDGESEDPAPHWELPRVGYVGISPKQCYQPPWSNELLARPEQLAKSLGENWDAAMRGLAGREAGSIKRFLGNFSDSDQAVQVLDASMPLERKLVILQMMLDPENPPHFDGLTLETASLRSSIDAANDGDKDAKAWLLAVVRSEALVSYGEHRQDERTAEAGRRLKAWFDQAEKVRESVPGDKQALASRAFEDALPELFRFAFGQQG